ncbi:MAG: TIGR04282 family arsenosugar biosynthesis glycosyltransferase [Pseudomonadota bacterium]
MRQLVLMVKEPRPGRVKTRLGAEIGMIDAAHWFRHTALGLARRLQDPRWSLWLAVSPDIAGLSSRVWPAHLQRLPQGPGDLGSRMGRLFRSLPPGPALIVGADIPGLTGSHIARAFSALGPCPAVLGPATDGGYWLVGLKRTATPPANLFANVRWSTSHALADTARTLPGPVALVDTLSDVDTAADLRELSPPPFALRTSATK